MASFGTSAIVAAILALAGAGSALASERQYDLRCTGTKDGVPYNYGFRIDLDQQRWCDSSCLATSPIVEEAPDRLTLEAVTEDTKDDLRRSSYSRTVRNEVSRVTGAHKEYRSHLSISRGTVSSRSRTEIVGTCEPAEFTGFPKAKF